MKVYLSVPTSREEEITVAQLSVQHSGVVDSVINIHCKKCSYLVDCMSSLGIRGVVDDKIVCRPNGSSSFHANRGCFIGKMELGRVTYDVFFTCERCSGDPYEITLALSV